MDIFEAIKTRRSIRAYSDTPVERAQLEKLLDAAANAPSAANSQPWSFSVITDRELISKVSNDAKAHILSVMDDMPFLERYRTALSNPDYDIFYNAPALITIYAANGAQTALSDCALAAQNLMLTAHALGLGSCWIGFAQMYLNTPAAKQSLSVPEELAVAAAIIVGHPKAQPPVVAKNPPKVLFWR